jgi:hypothetical protein
MSIVYSLLDIRMFVDELHLFDNVQFGSLATVGNQTLACERH